MDRAVNEVLYHAFDLVARAAQTESATPTTTSAAASATTSGAAAKAERPPVYKIVGIILAVCSGLFIGVSFVLKKVGLLKANVKYNEEAGEGYGYLKNFYWWSGMTLMILGEICNFVAYAFTDAILVTPLGALSVVITTILSAIFLKERLSFVGKLGCAICILGSIIIPLNAPEQSAVANIQEMQHFVISPGFLTYAGVIILGCTFTAFWAGPRYGKKSMLVYLSICSLIGGLSVVCTQGLGAAILAQINGEPQFNKWFTYVLLVFVIATLLTEIIYLNKALNLFNAALVTPTYYVYFTSSTIVASAVLFRGLHGTVIQIIDVILGFLVICAGVILLQLSKSAKDVPDTAVFTGDLDQVRTVAEQAEPEYEPRADTIRGSAGIVRAMSKVRNKREMEEVKRIHDERMEAIGEDEQFEWDGLRRRRTMSSAGGSGSISRRKSEHPPLGMSSYPLQDNVSEADSEVHPGFFGRIGRSGTLFSSSSRRSDHSPVQLSTVSPSRAPGSASDRPYTSRSRGSTLKNTVRAISEEEDISYQSPSRVHFANNDSSSRDRASSKGSSLAPNQLPPQTARRQFSFQNPFSRRKDGEETEERPPGSRQSSRPGSRPGSRPTLSFIGRHGSGPREYPAGDSTTEEERLGLVQGDSSNPALPRFTEKEEGHQGGNSDEDWQVTSGSSSSPEAITHADAGDLSRQQTYGDDVTMSYDEPLTQSLSEQSRYGNNGGGGRGGKSRGAFL